MERQKEPLKKDTTQESKDYKNKLHLKYIVIPIELFGNNKLTYADMFLFAFIHLLDGEKGCFANNSYLADLLNTSESTITNSISKLLKLKYIIKGGFDGRKRVLKVDLKYTELYKNKTIDSLKIRGRLRKTSEADSKEINKNENPTISIKSKSLNKDIYSIFLQEWNKNSLIKHKKITSKRKKIIDKILKTNDFSLEEIFKAFQNYSVVINSDDHYFNYKWTMEDFLQRGLDRFVDEALSLENFKNKSFQDNNQNNTQNQQSKNPLVNPTHKSMNLFPKEDIDTWVQYYSDFADQLIRADIWKKNYTPNKDKIFPKLLAQKNWLNNLIEIDGMGRVDAVIGCLRLLVKEFIDYTDWELRKENAWLDGITEAHLIPNGKFFQEFIRDEGNRMTALDGGIKIRSRGWGDDEGEKIESPTEIMLRQKNKREKDEEREREHEGQEREKAENIQIMLGYMKKYLSDIDKIDIKMLDLSKWFNDLNEQDFKDFVIEIEKQHQVNPGNRGYGYIPLWRKGLENLK